MLSVGRSLYKSEDVKENRLANEIKVVSWTALYDNQFHSNKYFIQGPKTSTLISANNLIW